jgi:hypothetical protein
VNIEDIIICFFRILKKNILPSKKYTKQIYFEAKEYLNNGWTVSNITNRIVMCDKQKLTNINSLHDIPYLQKTPPLKLKNNLLKNKFYYHYRLHKIPKSSIIKITVEGEIIKESYPFYLEIIEVFTLENLNEYFHSKLNIKDINLYEQNKKKLKTFIDSYNLDLVLFTIDEIAKKSKKEGWATRVAETIIYNIDGGQDKFNSVKNTSSGQIKPYYKAYLKIKEENKRGD